MSVGDQGIAAMMDGTTLCPHCDTRFKISGTQLNAHQGMVRCGHCLHIFDAHLSFIPDPPDPQLELPMPDVAAVEAALMPADEPPVSDEAAPAEHTEPESAELEPVEPAEPEIFAIGITETAEAEAPEAADIAHETATDLTEAVAATEEQGDNEAVDAQPQPMTLAEQVIIVHDEPESEAKPVRRTWTWMAATALLLLLLLAQAAYFFRVDLAARYPDWKPALAEYCRMLNCSIPLPQKVDQVSIESSSLEADPAHADRIILNALLRNHATFTQAFPHLELTLNDNQDKPLARRVFRPKDYLPPLESEEAGLQANHELNTKLLLDTSDLKPSGYRLVLFYPE